MADEPKTAVAAEKMAEAAVVDTAAAVTQQAAVAAQSAIASAAVVAEQAQVSAAERVEKIAAETGEQLAETESELSWLKTHAAATETELKNTSSALTTLAETQAKQGAFLEGMALKLDQLLTPVKPEPEGEIVKPEEEKEDAPKEVQTNQNQPPKRRHRSI